MGIGTYTIGLSILCLACAIVNTCIDSIYFRFRKGVFFVPFLPGKVSCSPKRKLNRKKESESKNIIGSKIKKNDKNVDSFCKRLAGVLLDHEDMHLSFCILFLHTNVIVNKPNISISCCTWKTISGNSNMRRRLAGDFHSMHHSAFLHGFCPF